MPILDLTGHVARERRDVERQDAPGNDFTPKILIGLMENRLILKTVFERIANIERI